MNAVIVAVALVCCPANHGSLSADDGAVSQIGEPTPDTPPASPSDPDKPRVPPGFEDHGVLLELSLEDAVRTALRNNVQVKVEELNRQISRRSIIIERAIFDPYFNVGFSHAKNRSPTVSPFEIGSTTFVGVEVNPFERTGLDAGLRGTTLLGSTYEVKITETRGDNPEASLFSLNPQYGTGVEVNLTQPLLKNAWFDYNSANIRIARNNKLLSDEQYELTSIQMVYDVVTAFWELVFAHEDYLAKVNALQLAEDQLRIDRRRVQAGTMAEIDLATSESQVARRKTELDEAMSVLETARDDLLYRMNYTGVQSLKRLWNAGRATSPFSAVLVVPSTEPEIEALEPERTASLESAFANRPEYVRAKLDIENQAINVASARNELLPSLDLNAGWTQSGLDENARRSIDRLVTGRFYDWVVGVQFEVQIPYRGRLSNYRNTRDALRQLELQQRDLENLIVIEVDQAIRELEFSYRAVQNLADEVRLQEAVLRAERSKLQAGTSDIFTVSQIENDLVDVRARELRAETDFEKGKAEYEKAVGTLLEKFGVVLE